MSNPGMADATLVTDVRDAAAWLAAGCKPAPSFGIGTEHEAFGFRLGDLSPPAFAPADGSAGIASLLAAIREAEGLTPILDAGNTIGLQGHGLSLSLEPGGQFELSGAIVRDLHTTTSISPGCRRSRRNWGWASRRSGFTLRRRKPTCRSCPRGGTRSCATTCPKWARAGWT